MKWYHGTSQLLWESIQAEGVLWGIRNAPSRCTYLASSENEASQHGKLVLEVEYDPTTNPKDNNYIDGCWQVRVYEPIPIEKVVPLLI